jgi:hypothetical protein
LPYFDRLDRGNAAAEGKGIPDVGTATGAYGPPSSITYRPGHAVFLLDFQGPCVPCQDSIRGLLGEAGILASLPNMLAAAGQHLERLAHDAALRSAVCTTNLGFGCQHAVTSQIAISYKAGACQQTAFPDHWIGLMHKVPLATQGCPRLVWLR